jgi:hypothetical protein
MAFYSHSDTYQHFDLRLLERMSAFISLQTSMGLAQSTPWYRLLDSDEENTKSPRRHLLTLPPELRNMISSYALSNDSLVPIGHQPGLLSACSQTCRDTRLMYFRLNSFVITRRWPGTTQCIWDEPLFRDTEPIASYARMIHWLEIIGPAACQEITRLEFHADKAIEHEAYAPFSWSWKVAKAAFQGPLRFVDPGALHFRVDTTGPAPGPSVCILSRLDILKILIQLTLILTFRLPSGMICLFLARRIFLPALLPRALDRASSRQSPTDAKEERIGTPWPQEYTAAMHRAGRLARENALSFPACYLMAFAVAFDFDYARMTSV